MIDGKNAIYSGGAMCDNCEKLAAALLSARAIINAALDQHHDMRLVIDNEAKPVYSTIEQIIKHADDHDEG